MTMTPEETAEFVNRLYATCAQGDWDTVATLLTDDFVAYEADTLPMKGSYHGWEGLRALYSKAFQLVDLGEIEPIGMTLGENLAIVVINMHFADPDLAPAELCELFRFRDGKCCEIKPYYYDPAPFVAAHEAKLAKAG